MGVSGSKTPRALTKEGRIAGAKFDDVELHVISLTYKDLAGLSKGDKGGESIDKATFLQNFPVPGLVGDRLFHALDSNKSGRISFDDFVVGLAVCCRGSLEEKMRFLFGVYDMNEDGLIGRDELLLMLNQVPRTLLNIGMDPSLIDKDDNPEGSPPFDWNSLTIAAETKDDGPTGGPSALITPAHSSRLNDGNGAGSVKRGAEFFGAGAGDEDAVPPPLPSARGRGARVAEKGSRGERGALVTPATGRLTSTFTNESIADQALKDFGGGADKPLTFEQFQRWAQSTPAVQALLQGAFPSDAHFSLATSPAARRSTCESLSAFESPRRPTSVRPFGTPSSSRESKSTATAISAVAAWSASASARPAPISGSNVAPPHRGPPLRLRSLGGETAFFPASGDQLPLGARTPSRNLSRNTSYDNLLRSPLVGQGVVPAASSPMATMPMHRGHKGVRRSVSDAGLGGGQGVATPKTWKWGQGGEEFFKTPRPGGGPGRGAKAWGSDEAAINSAGAGAGVAVGASTTSRSGIRKERERDRDAPPTPLTTGRVRRSKASSTSTSTSTSPPLPVPKGRPSRSSSEGAAAGTALTLNPATSSSSASGVDDAAPVVAAGPKPPQPAPRAFGGSSSVVNNSSGSSDLGAPPKTPSKPGVDSSERTSPPGTTDVTRKARKLAMMAAAAESAVSQLGADGGQPGTQDLLAYANAAAAGEKPPARPRRGKLMRYLSYDGSSSESRSVSGGGGGGSNTHSLPRLTRMTSLQLHDEAGQQQRQQEQPQGGVVPRATRKMLSFRRSNSLSAAEGKRREEASALDGGKDPRNIGIRPPEEISVAPAPRHTTPTTATPTGTTTATATGGVTGVAAVAAADASASATAFSSTSRRQAPAVTASSPRVRASQMRGEMFNSSSYAEDDPVRPGPVGGEASGGNGPALDNGGGGGAGHTKVGGHRKTKSSHIPSSGSGSGKTKGRAPTPPPMPATIVLPSSDLSLGLPHSNISPLLKADRGVFPFASDRGEDEAAQASAGAEAVVRDCLYNSHGMVALDGYLWKPGSIRLVRRWMMLVDNTLYYFVKPGDRKPRGVISLPGCIAEAVSSDDDDDEVAGHESPKKGKEKEPRKSRVPSGFYGLRLFRPNNHGKDSTARLFLAKSAQERDEWVAELRVASRVVPLEDIFELKGLLRKGAFASVHRCIRKDTKEEYAVKVIDKTSLSSHEKFLLRGEIGALKLVSHPNVVRLEAVHEDPRSIAIVMTLCRGGDLWDKVRSQPTRCFDANQARTVMRPLCEAVSYLHTLGILHRDIKPENILLVDDGAGNLGGVTLSDFGFSHQVSPKSRLACGKQLMGTPSYMAPESILHGMYGKEVDWFSCGCVLYMMLMGRAPFAGNSPSEIFRNTCHGRLGLGRGGASLWDKLPPAARELIVGLMQLDHNLRFTGEQAMSHRWLAMPDDQDKPDVDVDVDGDGERKWERFAGNNGQKQQQQQQQQRASQEGGGGGGGVGSGAGGGRRRREGSRNGTRKSSRGSSSSSSGGSEKGSSSRGVVAAVSSATSFATSSSGSTPGRGSTSGRGGSSASAVRS